MNPARALKVINFMVYINFLYDSNSNKMHDLVSSCSYDSPSLSLNYFRKLDNSNLINKNNLIKFKFN